MTGYSTTLPPREFHVDGEIPGGTTILEASAGTGKTYAIVGLAARLVAEGTPISELLIVTFSRMATAELRERTRIRLHDLADVLLDPGAARASSDPVARLLATGDRATIDERRSNITAALGDFDSATITTTHNFCSRMLDWLGIGGDRETDLTLVEDLDDLAVQVGRDLYLGGYAGREQRPFGPAVASEIAKVAVRNVHADLSPSVAADDRSPVAHRLRFAVAARAEVARRARRQRIRDFDDLQSTLYRVLTEPDHGAIAATRIRDRFSAVLVDEFQDTDPVQWEIFKICFHRHIRLILVGDPKQAIYAFRGAEILSYLDAVDTAGGHQVLGMNWRSDGDLVTACQHVFGGCALGDPRIVVHPVDAASPGTRLTGVAPLRLRHLGRAGHGLLNKSGFPAPKVMREAVCDDVAADIARLLASTARIVDATGTTRPIRPADIAILVRSHSVIPRLQSSLARHQIASVVGGGQSVFTTESADHWRWVLMGLESPQRLDRVRLAALSPLLGYTPADLDSGGDDLAADIGARLRSLAGVFERVGFAAMFERLAQGGDLQRRILEMDGGERMLTDLTHIAGLCNDAAVHEGLGISGLLRWISERMTDPRAGGAAEYSRRLDRDAHAVQIMTIHASKGLEFAIVYVPFGWDGHGSWGKETFVFHDDDGHRVVDVGGESAPGASGRLATSSQEESAEELRLTYVAITRARCQVVLYWAPVWGTAHSPVHRLLFGDTAAGQTPPQRVPVPPDVRAVEHLRGWAASSDVEISVEPADGSDAPDFVPTPATVSRTQAVAAHFDRIIDSSWTRTSYTAIVAAGAVDASPVSDPDPAAPSIEVNAAGSETDLPPVLHDEPDRDVTDELLDGETSSLIRRHDMSRGVGEKASTDLDAIVSRPSPMNGLPYGAAFGTVVHDILEHVDTSAPSLRTEVSRRVTESSRRAMMALDVERLTDALVEVLHTPLRLGGTDTHREDEVDLAAIPPRRRRSELTFEFPLAGGDHPVDAEVTIRAIADLLDTWLPGDDPLAGYSARLRLLTPRRLRGYLTGSIDSVLRVGPDEDSRYVVVDYKTNRLGGAEALVGDYRADLLAAEMMHAHYPLQALLYSVALHRFLRWRLPDYDPACHLGPVQYHFVRGMIGPVTPAGYGIFHWHPPAEMITACSDVLAGRR